MPEPAIVNLEGLRQEPYASIICYPRCEQDELLGRLQELETHEVTAIEFAGKANAFNVPILGKGYVGLVVIAHLNVAKAALKIRRIDADRSGLQHEAEMLVKANATNVGPRLFNVSKNFLLMQLIEGDSLPSWVETHEEKEALRRILNEILEQCWRLDNVGLDHGELSHAPKHLIVDHAQKPWIVDFETASVNRKPANVTAVCQFLFTSNGTVARAIAEILGNRSRESLVDALRAYKRNRTRENFERLLQICLS